MKRQRVLALRAELNQKSYTRDSLSSHIKKDRQDVGALIRDNERSHVRRNVADRVHE
jgi:hypothetical protein